MAESARTKENADRKGDFLRRPPASVEAEQALLSAILANNKSYEAVFEFLRPEHFTEAAHQKIYAALSELIGKGHLADLIILKNHMERSGVLEGISPDYLSSLAGAGVSVINARDYGRLIYDLAQKRGLIELGTEVVNDAYSDPRPAEDLLDSAEKKLMDLSAKGMIDSRLVPFDAALGDSLRVIERAYQSDGHVSGVSTGFEAMDKILGGLQPSDLVILAARPSMGKTALALNIAFNVANEVLNGRHAEKLKGPVAFFSLEMSTDQLTQRVLSMNTEINSNKMMKGTITEAEFQKLAEHSREMSRLPLFIDDTAGVSVAGIRARARRLKAEHKGLSLVVVDYIQLISGDVVRRDANRVQEVSEITRALKIMAKELDVPVLALSQLSRQVESRDDKQPQLADLRESGSIEQDADVVMFIYREDYYLKEPKEPGSPEWLQWKARHEKVANRADIIVAKQRRGPTGQLPLGFVREFTRFRDFHEGSDPHV